MAERFPVDAESLGPMVVVLDVVRQACSAAEVGYFIIGAAARDLLLEHVYGVAQERATGDVDVAVAVRSWDDYRGLIDILCSVHGFSPAEEPQRMRRGALVLDIVPYGGVAQDGQIEWPDS